MGVAAAGAETFPAQDPLSLVRRLSELFPMAGAQPRDSSLAEARPPSVSEAQLVASLKVLDILRLILQQNGLSQEAFPTADAAQAGGKTDGSRGSGGFPAHKADGADGELQAGPIRVYPDRADVFVNDRHVKLTPIQFKILSLLVARRGRLVSNAAMTREIWGSDLAPGRKLIKLHIRNLRLRLGDPAPDRSPIVSVRGLGYKIRLA